MAVVINELEIVVENPQAAQDQHAAPASPHQLGAMDVFDVEERLMLYRLRLLAH